MTRLFTDSEARAAGWFALKVAFIVVLVLYLGAAGYILRALAVAAYGLALYWAARYNAN